MASFLPYTSDDLPKMLEVIKLAFKEQVGVVNPPSSAARKMLAVFQEELQAANAFVAEQEKQVVGCVVYEIKDYRLYFSRLAVMPI